MAKRNGGIIGPDNVPAGPLGAAGGVWRLEDAFNYQKAGLWPVVLGYQIPNSLRFNFGSSDYLTRTPSTSGNRRTFTISVWLKRSLLSSGYPSILSNNNNGFGLDFSDTNFIRFAIGTSSDAYFYTTQLFRDPSAWYHIVAVVDTTDSTSTDRMKLYVNGTRVTSFSTSVFPAQNVDTNINTSGIANQVGANTPYSSYFSGYMSEFYLIDGQALTPSSFGETDSTTGIWIPKAYSGTYGTNGFYLKFANSAALGTDSSGNGNTFTVNNLTSVDQSYDSPTNNFATLNPLLVGASGVTPPTFSEGNLRVTNSTDAYKSGMSTIIMSKGKWYCEYKFVAGGAASCGIIEESQAQAAVNSSVGVRSLGWAYNNNGYWYNNDVGTLYGSTYTTGDIISIALDMDNNKLYFAKNGTWQNSGVPTSGSTGTGALSVTSGYNYYFGFAPYSTNGYIDVNFGYTTYAANSYADANGFGNFSYAVPSGYYSLCSKNLAIYG